MGAASFSRVAVAVAESLIAAASDAVGIVRRAKRRFLVSSSPRALMAPPDKKITGRTGKIHGDIPVMMPPKKPIRARLSMRFLHRTV